MAKNTFYICTSCKHQTTKDSPSCPKCKNFGTLEESAQNDSSKSAVSKSLNNGYTTPVKKTKGISELNATPLKRLATGIGELDRVLGGGFVPGEVALLAGQPGSGKSTIALSIAEKFANMNKTVLISSGEESEQQIALRAKRMGITNENIRIINEVNLETVIGHIRETKAEFVIVDSLQTIESDESSGTAGSISQSKFAAIALTRLAKSENITMLLINQVTKD